MNTRAVNVPETPLGCIMLSHSIFTHRVSNGGKFAQEWRALELRPIWEGLANQVREGVGYGTRLRVRGILTRYEHRNSEPPHSYRALGRVS